MQLLMCCAHSTATPVRESMRKYYGCMHVSLCVGMPVQFVCCACYSELMISKGCSSEGEKKRAAPAKLRHS